MNTLRKRNRLTGISAILAVAFATIAASCASTEMTSTWTDPTARGASLSRVAVVCLTKDPGLRRMAEDAAAAQMTGAQAVPSYQVLGDTSLQDRQTVKAKLMDAGFDGVLIMRLAGVTERVTPVTGPYGTFDGYYDWAGAAVYAPGYLETETVVHVVSNLYSLNQNKLIWSGASQTFDPASAKQFMTDVSKAVAKSLQKDRLIL
jgi:hypothetical protein